MAVDINGFGDPRRTGSDQQFLRKALHEMLAGALAAVGVPRGLGVVEDRGDGALIVVSSAIPTGLFVDDVVAHLTEALRLHNRRSAELFRIRMRMALHAGHVVFDDYGVIGPALIHLFRILEAPDFRNAFDLSMGDLGVAVSDYLYEEVVRDGRGGIDPEKFVLVPVEHKDTKATCWVNLGARSVPMGHFDPMRPPDPALHEQAQPA
jgi:hypothetical protein